MKLKMSILLSLLILVGCAGQSATSQIYEQTTDPVSIAKTIYVDALGEYNEALQAYLPYKALLEKSNPGMAVQIKDMFSSASDMLDEWDTYAKLGELAKLDRETFKAFRRDVLIMIAEMEGLK